MGVGVGTGVGAGEGCSMMHSRASSSFSWSASSLSEVEFPVFSESLLTTWSFATGVCSMLSLRGSSGSVGLGTDVR